MKLSKIINKLRIVLIFFIIYSTISGDVLLAANKQIIYINSNKLEADRKNSVYDIDYKNGTIYVADYRNNKIIIIGKDNLVVKKIDTPQPHGIEVDNKGNIYVASFFNSRIRKFDESGVEKVNWDIKIRGLLHDIRPYSVDTDNEGNVYIAADNLIIKVLNDGRFIKKFDFSKFNAEKVYPHGITFHESKIYVAERNFGKLLVFNTEGEYQKSFSTLKKTDFDPPSINFYDNTHILVPNYANSTLHIFDINGKELKIVGRKGKDYREWFSLMNAIEDKKGNIYTVEEDSNRIQIINFLELINSN